MLGRILLVILVVLTASCRTAQQKLDRLVKKHPELVKSDTTVIHDTLRIAERIVRTEYTVKTDTVKDAALAEALLSQVSMADKEKEALKKKLVMLLSERAILKDTLYYEDKDIAIKAWREGLTYKFDITRKAIEMPYVKKEVVNTIKPQRVRAFYQDKWFWIAFVLGLILLLWFICLAIKS